MLLADFIQLLILLVLIMTAYIALKELHETKNIHRETLEWNRKNKTITVLNEFRKINISVLRETFNKHTKIPGTTISLTLIIDEIKNNAEVKSSIIRFLNHHEGLALGIKLGLYDREMIKLARKTSFIQNYNEYIEYIKYRREISNPNAWKNFEELVKKWSKNEL